MNARRPAGRGWVRIIGGSLRGRRIPVPDVEGVRPTADRVREALFNALWSRDIPAGAEVVDLFAGTGALGFEALSRGADRATFVDVSHAVTRAVEQNAATLGVGKQVRVVRGDGLGWLRTAALLGGPVGDDDAAPIGLFCDPPYAFDRWAELLELAAGYERVEWIVTESRAPVDCPPESGWEISWTRTYGIATVALLERL